MASRGLRLAGLLTAVLLTAGACSDDPAAPAAAPSPTPSPTPTPEPVCPLSGETPANPAVLERPAVAVKVENNPAAYPLAGLEDAEIVYEELVEGGITRFLALYHCTDAKKAGPVRSSRVIDPLIIGGITRILGAAGGNAPVRRALDEGNIVLIDENTGGEALQRIPRPGITFEHTLYADTAKVRKAGEKSFDKPPSGKVFRFGPLPEDVTARRARSVQMSFGGSASVSYRWTGKAWERFDNGEPAMTEAGGQIRVDNVVIELHRVVLSRRIVDVAGNPSIEIADETGAGRAVLLRDGRAIKGRWRRKASGAVVFETAQGKPMVLKPGTTWIELVPDDTGEIKGSFKISRKP